MIRALAAAGGGFLLAVLWFDLMFDVQVLRHRRGELPEPVLASIAAYYRRVTTDALPMGYALAVVMLVTIAATVAEIRRGVLPMAPGLLALVLCTVPAALALWRVLPGAARLGTRADSAAEQSALARMICRDHFVGLVAILGFLAIQVAGRRLPLP